MRKLLVSNFLTLDGYYESKDKTFLNTRRRTLDRGASARRACRRVALAFVMAAGIAACQVTVPVATVLLDKSGNGSGDLPAFTSRGTYSVSYSYDHCPNVTGMAIRAHSGANVATLLMSTSATGSGVLYGDQAGRITLEVQSRCQWKVSVSG